MLADLASEFQREMLEMYEEAKRPPCKYNATYFRRMLDEHGGVETARRLLVTEQPQEGLTRLFLCGRLDLTLERHVLIPRFRPLFTAETLTAAQRRLTDLGYAVNDDGNLVCLNAGSRP